LALERIVNFFQVGTGALPSVIPSWLDLILTGGTTIGIIVFLILLIAGIKILTKFIPFFTWLLIGILCGIVISVVFPALNLPNPFEWIISQLGTGGE